MPKTVSPRTPASGASDSHRASEPHVSVIMAARAAQATIGQAVSSVLDQSFKRLELIVVCDSLSDASIGRAQATAAGDPRLRTALSKGAGPAAARNAGIAASRGRFLAFLDADDTWQPGALAALVEHLDAAESFVGLVYGWMDRVGRIGAYRMRCPTLSPSDDPFESAIRLRMATVGLQSIVARRDDVERAGGFDEALSQWEDIDFVMKMARIVRFQHVAATVARYVERGGSLSARRQEWAGAHERILHTFRSELATRPDAHAIHARVLMRNWFYAGDRQKGRLYFAALERANMARPRDRLVKALGPALPWMLPLGRGLRSGISQLRRRAV